ncbi:unnamed protein product [Auanema sp. JU1783]|nr:unnamed protein product [Auanema sp. JU1783]
MTDNSDGITVKFFIWTRKTNRLYKGVATVQVDEDKFILLPTNGKGECFFPNEFGTGIPDKFVNKIELEFIELHSYKSLVLEATHSNSNFGGDSHFRMFIDALRCLFANESPFLDEASVHSSFSLTTPSSIRSTSNVNTPASAMTVSSRTTPSLISGFPSRSRGTTPTSAMIRSGTATPSSLMTRSGATTPSSLIARSGATTPSSLVALSGVTTPSNFTARSGATTPSAKSGGSGERPSVTTGFFYGTPSTSRSSSRASGNTLRAVPKYTDNTSKSLTQIANDYKPVLSTLKVQPRIREETKEENLITRYAVGTPLTSHDAKSRKTAFTQKTASTSCMKDEELQIEVVNLEEEEILSSPVANPAPKTHKSLKNIGNSCYSNAVLQVLGCLDRFRKELLECEADMSINSMKPSDAEFVKCLTHILRRLACSNKRQGVREEILYEFRELCGKHLGGQFGSCEQQDASEFFNNLLDYLQSTEALSKNPANLFRIENDQLIFCKCGASRNKTEVENMLTVSTGRSRKPSIRKIIGQFFVEEKVKIDCDSCKMKSRLAGRFVSIKHLPKYLAVSVRRYDFKNDSVEKVNSSIHINKNLYLKHLCYDSKANEAQDFCRNIRDASESPRKLQVIENAQITPRPALRNILQKGGAPMGAYVDERELTRCRKRRMEETARVPTPISSPAKATPVNTRMSANESFSSEPKILEISKTPKKVIAFQPLRTSVIQELQCIVRKKTTPLYLENDVETWRKVNVHRKCSTDLEVEPHIKSVDGDGNCLFRSLSWWIFCGNEKGHGRLRNRLCDFLAQHSEHFSCFLNSVDTMEKHIEEMRQDGHWGTYVEISAAATLFNIVIFTYFQSWKIFRPMFRMKNGAFGGRLKLNGDQIDELIAERGSIYIHNESNYHFSPAYAPKVMIEQGNAVNIEEFIVSPEKAIIRKKIIQSPVRVVANTDTDISSEDEDEDEREYRKENDPMYSLVGVVSHHGPNVHSGHYTSYCFDSLSGVWLDCNDEHIREIDEATVLEQSSKSGYLFFYERRRVGDQKSFEQKPID